MTSKDIISNREVQVLSMISSEMTAHQIADELVLSTHTIISHRKNLMAKLKAKNVAGLIRRGFETGLLTI